MRLAAPLLYLLPFFLALCAAPSALAQAPGGTSDWPSKPVRIIVPFAAGGGTDLTARITAQKLSAKYGQPFIVENKPGAGGSVGTDIVAKSKPDGYTLVVVSGSHTINPSLYKSLPYNTLKDFLAVSNLVSGPALMVVHPGVAASNVREFIALAKTKPGAFASSGNGSPPHLGGELFNALAGVQMVHVPYKGNGPAYADLIGGQVQVMFPNIATAMPLVKAGKLKVLAVTSRERTRIAPEIPTIAEAGLPEYELNSWFGLLAPAGTPAAIVNRLQQDIAKFYQEPQLRQTLMEQGVEPLASTPEAFTAQIQSETAYWAQMFKRIKVTVD
jgi:tripartite-type tricarboxylate transporter receptor subunit TctC